MARNRSSRNNTFTWTIIIALIIGFLGGYLVARSKYISKIGAVSELVMERSENIDDLNRRLNSLTMTEDGRMVQLTNGRITPLREAVTFGNGATVLVNGTVVPKEGEDFRLKPGEAIDMNGELIIETGENNN